MIRGLIRAVSGASPWLLLEVALVTALLVLSHSTVAQLRQSRRAVDSWREHWGASDEFRGPGAEVTSLGGIAASGPVPELLNLPQGSSRFVAFVLHAATLRSDLPFWTAVQRDVGGSGVVLVGYCDGASCAAAIADGPAPPFPVLAYTVYHTARVLLRADAEGRCVVLNSKLRILGSVEWERRRSPAQVAAAIKGQL